MENGFWEYHFNVRSFDVDRNKNMTITSVCEYLQEVAGDHANNAGFGYRQVIQNDMVWVISTIKIEIDRLPRWEEIVNIKTWVVSNNRFLSRRDFQWVDQDGNSLLKASTQWILFQTKKRRPVLVDQMDFPVIMHPETKATNSETVMLKGITESDEISMYKVRHSDLDMVGHMNNTKYIQLFLNQYNPEYFLNKRIKQFDISFKTEAYYDDNLIVDKNTKDQNSHLLQLKRQEDGKINCLAKIEWLDN